LMRSSSMVKTARVESNRSVEAQQHDGKNPTKTYV
jgi:hypothetical protein